MKYCPNCQTTYTDDTLRFCLQDGAKLADVANSSTDMPTVSFDESATVVSPKPPQQVVRINVPEPESQNRERAEQPRIIEQPRIVGQPRVVTQPVETRKSNTALTVLATVLGMLLLFGIAGAWFLLKSRNHEAAAINSNVNTAPLNRPAASNAANIQNLNANTAKPTASPIATPVAKPSLRPEDAKAVTEDVKNAVDDWVNSSENLDLDANLNQYADSVDYYIAGRINRARVRADKQRAFDQYDSINFHISNMRVTPDASGDKATAVFDKEWKFEGENKYSSGKVQQQLTLAKIGGRWLITGERDLKTYYVEK
jgi:ketosteroid isomerase-like protein